MNSTLKAGAAMLLLVMLAAPEAASARNARHARPTCDPFTDGIACAASPGTYRNVHYRTRRQRSIVARNDCGQSAMEEAQGLNMLGSAAGVVPVPGVGLVVGVIAGQAASDASSRAETQRFACLKREVHSQIAAIGKQLEKEYAKDAEEFRARIAAIEERLDERESDAAPAAPPATQYFAPCSGCAQPKPVPSEIKPDVPLASAKPKAAPAPEEVAPPAASEKPAKAPDIPQFAPRDPKLWAYRLAPTPRNVPVRYRILNAPAD